MITMARRVSHVHGRRRRRQHHRDYHYRHIVLNRYQRKDRRSFLHQRPAVRGNRNGFDVRLNRRQRRQRHRGQRRQGGSGVVVVHLAGVEGSRPAQRQPPRTSLVAATNQPDLRAVHSVAVVVGCRWGAAHYMVGVVRVCLAAAEGRKRPHKHLLHPRRH